MWGSFCGIKDMGKNKEIKDMSIYEAASFWDEHNFDEFGDFEEVTVLNFH